MIQNVANITYWLATLSRNVVFKDKIVDLVCEGKIELEDEKLSSNQVSIASDIPNMVMNCNFVEGNNEQDIPNIN